MVSAATGWAIERGDIRIMALARSWARGSPHQVSDIDLLLLSAHREALAARIRPRAPLG